MSISKCKLKIERLYLMYLNEYLTIGRFAEDYSISEDRARRIVNTGRKLNRKW